MQQVQIVCPPGVGPGAMIQANVNGQMMQVQVRAPPLAPLRALVVLSACRCRCHRGNGMCPLARDPPPAAAPYIHTETLAYPRFPPALPSLSLSLSAVRVCVVCVSPVAVDMSAAQYADPRTCVPARPRSS